MSGRPSSGALAPGAARHQRTGSNFARRPPPPIETASSPSLSSTSPSLLSSSLRSPSPLLSQSSIATAFTNLHLNLDPASVLAHCQAGSDAASVAAAAAAAAANDGGLHRRPSGSNFLKNQKFGLPHTSRGSSHSPQSLTQGSADSPQHTFESSSISGGGSGIRDLDDGGRNADGLTAHIRMHSTSQQYFQELATDPLVPHPHALAAMGGQGNSKQQQQQHSVGAVTLGQVQAQLQATALANEEHEMLKQKAKAAKRNRSGSMGKVTRDPTCVRLSVRVCARVRQRVRGSVPACVAAVPEPLLRLSRWTWRPSSPAWDAYQSCRHCCRRRGCPRRRRRRRCRCFCCCCCCCC
jgi:hypothetical protein